MPLFWSLFASEHVFPPRLRRHWWSARARQFPAGTRHLRGRPITRDGCLAALREGRQHERAAAALGVNVGLLRSFVLVGARAVEEALK